jgi:hypothetical protein
MLETYFSASKLPGHLRSGSSGPYLDRFAAALERQCYSADTGVRYLRAAEHLGHVVARQGPLPNDIDLGVFSEHLPILFLAMPVGGEYRQPAALEHVRRVLSIPFKKTDRRLVP